MIEPNKVNQGKIEEAVKMILEAVGEDINREGLIDTPKRVAKMYTELFNGLHEDPRECLKVNFVTDEHDEMIMVKDISFYSMCEHHLLPFYGTAHLGYLPAGGKIVGLSKLVRVIETVSRRPQLQERLTTQVADAVMEMLAPKGVVVVVEAEHLCMSIRGVKKPGAITVTSAVRGLFRRNPASREEAFSLINKGR